MKESDNLYRVIPSAAQQSREILGFTSQRFPKNFDC